MWPRYERWYYRNWQGGIIAEVDSSGTATSTYSYDAYGKVDDATGSLFRYTGQVLDAETGLRGLTRLC